MKIEISDEVYEDYRKFLAATRYSIDVSSSIESLIELSIRGGAAVGYKLDGLTGCNSGFQLKRDVRGFTPSSSREGHELFCKSYLCVDVHHFKSYNDVHGHNEGDKQLIQIAEALRSRYPQSPSYRFGGDEFVLDLQEEPFSGFDIPAPVGITLKFALVQVTARKNQSQWDFIDQAILFHIEEGIARATPQGVKLAYDYTDVK